MGGKASFRESAHGASTIVGLDDELPEHGLVKALPGLDYGVAPEILTHRQNSGSRRHLAGHDMCG
jgi:hypothetical protein